MLADKERVTRIGGLCALAFVTMASYAVARPSTESIFLTEHGSAALPRVWLLVAVVAALVTGAFNKAVAGRELARLFADVCLVSSGILAALLWARSAEVPGMSYALYVWKDVYVVVLVETFWAFANAVFPFKTARWSYGLFCVMGSLGGMVGNLGIGQVAQEIGTARAPWLVIPLLVVSAILAVALSKAAGSRAVREEKVRPRLLEGLKVLKQSRYLGLLLILIAVVQVVVTLIDFSTNAYIEKTWSDPDERTEVIGQIYAAIDVGAIALQVLTGVILRALGVVRTLLLIPALLGSALLGFLLLPRFALLATAKVASKALDYSLFRAAKEILYLPLSYAEKTQGKGVVDILTYRVAKGAASMLLLLLVEAAAPPGAATLVGLVLCVAWAFVIVGIGRRYRAVAGDDEISAPPPG